MYMRELGEGQFGKVLLMKAKVCKCYNNNVVILATTSNSDERCIS